MFLESIKSSNLPSLGTANISLEEFANIKAISRDLYLMDDEGRVTGSGRKAIVLEQSPNDVLYVGTNYEVIQNEELVPVIENIQKRTGYEVHRIRSSASKRFSVELRSDDPNLKIGHEPAYPSIVIGNSYDGSSKVTFNYGIVIQVCTNGATVTKSINGLVQKHTGKIDFNYERLLEEYASLSKALSGFNDKHFDAGSDVALGNMKRLASIFPDTTKKLPHPMAEALAERAEAEMKTNGYPANFALFMAATNMTTYPDRYGLATSYIPQLERASTDV